MAVERISRRSAAGGVTAQADGAAIALNFHARNVYLVVGGTGSITVTHDGETVTLPVSGPPNMRQVLAENDSGAGHLEVALSKGLQAFSFTYG